MSEGWRSLAPQVDAALAAHDVPALRGWLRTRPHEDYVSLGRSLGVRPVLLERYVRDLATRESWASEHARDALVRELRRALPGGWGRGDGPRAADYARADAIAGWAELVDLPIEPSVLRAFEWLDATAAPGWLPDDLDDPLVVEVVRLALQRDREPAPDE